MARYWAILAVLAVALAGRARSVAVAACVVLIVQVLGFGDSFYDGVAPTLGTIGVALLLVQTLGPLATQATTPQSLGRSLASPLAMAAFGLSVITTYLSGRGVTYMNTPANAAMFIPLLLGSVASAALFKGLPVGPYITAGVLSVLGTWLTRLAR